MFTYSLKSPACENRYPIYNIDGCENRYINNKIFVFVV